MKLKFFLLSLFFVASVQAKMVNVTTNPLGLLLKVANVAIDAKVTENFSLGGEFQLIDTDDGFYEESGSGYGVRANYWFNKTFEDSWWVSGRAGLVDTDVTYTFLTSTAETSADGTYFGVLFGYGWFWDNFNMGLGFGYMVYSLDVESTSGSVVFSSPLDGGVPAIEFTLGFAF